MPQKRNKNLFPITFLIITALISFLFVKYIPDFIWGKLVGFTFIYLETITTILKITATYEPPYFTIFNFPMKLVFECTAFNYIGIYALAILLSTGIKTINKIEKIILGSTILLIMNSFRLIILGYIGAYHYNFFETTHIYIFPAIFIITVLLLFSFFSKEEYKTENTRSFITFFVTLIISIFLTKLVMPNILNFVSKTLNLILKSFIIKDAIVITEKNLLIFSYKGKMQSLDYRVSLYFLTIIPAIVGFYYSKNKNKLRLIFSFFIWLTSVFFVHIIVLIYLFSNFSKGDIQEGNDLLWLLQLLTQILILSGFVVVKNLK